MRNEAVGLSKIYGDKPWVLTRQVSGVAAIGDIVECIGVERHGKDRRLQCIVKVGADHHKVDAPPNELFSEPSLQFWGPALSSKWWSIDGHHVYVYEFEEWRNGKTWALIADGGIRCYVDDIDYLELRACPTPSRGPLTLMEASQLLQDGWHRIQIE